MKKNSKGDLRARLARPVPSPSPVFSKAVYNLWSASCYAMMPSESSLSSSSKSSSKSSLSFKSTSTSTAAKFAPKVHAAATSAAKTNPPRQRNTTQLGQRWQHKIKGNTNVKVDPLQLQLYRSIIRNDRKCVYCGDAATAMDHFRAFMQSQGRPSGFKNDMWNMVPCCITCNSSKGNRSWRLFMTRTSGKTPLARGVSAATHRRRVLRLEAFERTGNKYVETWASNKFAAQLDALRTSMLHAIAKHAVVIRRLGLHILKYEKKQRLKKQELSEISTISNGVKGRR